MYVRVFNNYTMQCKVIACSKMSRFLLPRDENFWKYVDRFYLSR